MKNLLEYISKDHIFYEPFPHIVAENLLPTDLYDSLASSFPETHTVTHSDSFKSNERFDYVIKQMRDEGTMSEIWQSFSEANASQAFFEKFVEIFGSTIYSLYPNFATQYKPLTDFRPGIRNIHSYSERDILLDSHVSINTPVTTKPSSVRSVHVDDPLKLYGGLFYLRAHGDESVGGDLQIYRFIRDDYQFYGQHVDERYVQVVKTIPYKANTFVFFVNSIESLHGVTVRELTSHTRQFFNIVGELPSPLFDIKSRQESIWRKRFRRYKAKFTGQGGKW